jgi:hypothetical protein
MFLLLEMRAPAREQAGLFLWHGIVATRAPGMAARDAGKGEVAAGRRAMLLQRL